MYKVVFVFVLLFALSFDACKRKCWHCHEKDINWMYSTRICDEATKDVLEGRGQICW